MDAKGGVYYRAQMHAAIARLTQFSEEFDADRCQSIYGALITEERTSREPNAPIASRI
jgi:hypothetical protein